ncbi:MAG: hypothetical protein WCT77_09800 [Bacteroidota bacterium]
METQLKLRLLIIFVVFISFETANCEPYNYAIGVTGGYLNAYNDVQYAYYCSCSLMNDFNKSSYFSGITFEYPLKIGLESSIITRFYYNSFSNNYFNSNIFPIAIYNEVTDQNEVVMCETRFEWDIQYTLLSLDILPKIKLPFIKLGIFAGVSLNYLIDSKYDEIYRLISPKKARFPVNEDPEKYGYRYADSNRTIFVTEGKIPYKNDFRFGLKAGLTYDFEYEGFMISPFVSIDYPLNPVVKQINTNCSPEICDLRADAHWRIIYYQAGIDLKYLF